MEAAGATDGGVTSGSTVVSSSGEDATEAMTSTTQGTSDSTTEPTDPTAEPTASTNPTGTDPTEATNTTSDTADPSEGSGSAECGNGKAEANEDCDGGDLRDASCISRGFESGALRCDAGCMFDETECLGCGDGLLNGSEECDGDELNGRDCESLGFAGGTLACNMLCGFDESGCVPPGAPTAGDIVITEVMKRPVTVNESAGGEWIEIYNTTDTLVALEGCDFSVAGPGILDNVHFLPIDGPLNLGPGEYATLAPSSGTGPGFTPSFSFSANSLDIVGSSGVITFRCVAVVLIDVLDYRDDFPNPEGAAMSLDPDQLGAIANNDPNNWCDAVGAYNGDLGTPGGANPQCSGS